MNTIEQKRYKELKLLESAREIKSLYAQPEFRLHNKDGHYIADYTPDFTYRDKGGQYIAEELKGSEKQHSATRQDYKLRVKWFLSEYPEYRFFQIIGKKTTEFVIGRFKSSGKVYLKEIKEKQAFRIVKTSLKELASLL